MTSPRSAIRPVISSARSFVSVVTSMCDVPA
jgi:hypothetical protein